MAGLSFQQIIFHNKL